MDLGDDHLSNRCPKAACTQFNWGHRVSNKVASRTATITLCRRLASALALEGGLLPALDSSGAVAVRIPRGPVYQAAHWGVRSLCASRTSTASPSPASRSALPARPAATRALVEAAKVGARDGNMTEIRNLRLRCTECDGTAFANLQRAGPGRRFPCRAFEGRRPAGLLSSWRPASVSQTL